MNRLFFSSFSSDGNWKITFPGDFTARERESHGKADISTGTVWMEIGNVHGNGLDGNGKSRFFWGPFGYGHGNDNCTGAGINPNSRETLREYCPPDISRGLP